MKFFRKTEDAESEAFAKEVASLEPWRQNLHLPQGQTAPGLPRGDWPASRWKRLEPHLPVSLEAWKALVVGCNAGFCAFELGRRGAQTRGVDIDNHYLLQAEWAAEKLGLEEVVAFERQTAYEAAAQPDRYDLIWFADVFRHLRYPILTLDLLARKATRLFILECSTRPETNPGASAPLVELLAPRSAHRHADWWAPSSSALESLLDAAGLDLTARPDGESFVCRPKPQQSELSAGRKLAVAELAAASRAFGISDRIV